MKKVVFFLGIIGSVWACSSASAGEPETDGHQVYKSYCISCHGANGKMGVSGAFDLTTSTLSLEERVLVITNGRNVMTSFKTLLPPRKIRAVAEYTMQLKAEE